MHDAAIGLGSNLGDRRALLAAALRSLDAELSNMAVSSLWETRPVEVDEPQPDFLNLCVAGGTGRDPVALLRRCRELERAAGREADSHMLPRPLDLDLLFHASGPVDTESLRLPHPGLARRAFVLAPLAEIRPAWRHPESGDTVSEMLSALGDTQGLIRREEEAGWWR